MYVSNLGQAATKTYGQALSEYQAAKRVYDLRKAAWDKYRLQMAAHQQAASRAWSQAVAHRAAMASYNRKLAAWNAYRDAVTRVANARKHQVSLYKSKSRELARRFGLSFNTPPLAPDGNICTTKATKAYYLNQCKNQLRGLGQSGREAMESATRASQAAYAIAMTKKHTPQGVYKTRQQLATMGPCAAAEVMECKPIPAWPNPVAHPGTHPSPPTPILIPTAPKKPPFDLPPEPVKPEPPVRKRPQRRPLPDVVVQQEQADEPRRKRPQRRPLPDPAAIQPESDVEEPIVEPEPEDVPVEMAEEEEELPPVMEDKEPPPSAKGYLLGGLLLVAVLGTGGYVAYRALKKPKKR